MPSKDLFHYFMFAIYVCAIISIAAFGVYAWVFLARYITSGVACG